MLFGQ
jgi:hypothetical protein